MWQQGAIPSPSDLSSVGTPRLLYAALSTDSIPPTKLMLLELYVSYMGLRNKGMLVSAGEGKQRSNSINKGSCFEAKTRPRC